VYLYRMRPTVVRVSQVVLPSTYVVRILIKLSSLHDVFFVQGVINKNFIVNVTESGSMTVKSVQVSGSVQALSGCLMWSHTISTSHGSTNSSNGAS
jgi:hypothetical protein